MDALSNMDREEKSAGDVNNDDKNPNKMTIVDEKNINSNVEYTKILKNPASNLGDMNIKENLVNKLECYVMEESSSSIEVIDEENPSNTAENIATEENLVNKLNSIDMDANLTSSIEVINEEIPSNTAENIATEENLVNKLNSIDMDANLTSSIEVLNEEILSNNAENVNTQKILVNKLDCIDMEDSLNSSIEVINEENPGNNLEEMNIKDIIENKIENTDTVENLASIVEITSGEISDTTAENIDSEDNFADIEENCDDEKECASDFERLFMNLTDVKGKIARFTMSVRGIKSVFDPMLVEFKSIYELLQPSDLNRNSNTPEKYQEIMAHMEKIDSSLSFIKRELKNWDLVDYSRIEYLKKLMSNYGKDERSLEDILKAL